MKGSLYQFLGICFLPPSPEEIVPYIVVDLVCLWEEVSSGSFYVNILNLELGIFLIIKTSYASEPRH